MHALEAKCVNIESAASKNTVAQLSELLPAHKTGYLNNAVVWGLPNIVRCALEAMISANTRGTSALKRPVLVAAAMDGCTRIVKQLLDAGADLNFADSQGFTALNSASASGYVECDRLLLAAGADANKADVLGITPLMNAIAFQRTECAQILLPASNLLATNRQGRSALHVCALAANKECFELLLPLVSDVDQRTLPGTNPDGSAIGAFNQSSLHICCARGLQQMAMALLKRGANRMARDSLQLTPLSLASGAGHLSCCVLLVGQPGRRKMTPAEVDAAAVDGRTALHLAAINWGGL